MDIKLLEALYWKGVPVFDMGSHMSTLDVGWGSPTFHKMGREKVILIDSFLPFGFELLMCDTDMVWLKVIFTHLCAYMNSSQCVYICMIHSSAVDNSWDPGEICHFVSKLHLVLYFLIGQRPNFVWEIGAFVMLHMHDLVVMYMFRFCPSYY